MREFPRSGLAETSSCVRRSLLSTKGKFALSAYPSPVPPANRKKTGADQKVPGQASQADGAFDKHERRLIKVAFNPVSQAAE